MTTLLLALTFLVPLGTALALVATGAARPGGPSGAVEAGLCWLAMVDNPGHRLPPHWWDGEPDPALPALAFVPPGATAARPLRHVLSQSFAFGGSNAVLVFGEG